MKIRTIVIILLIISLATLAYFGIKNSNKEIELLTQNSIEDINTTLLQAQAKVKVIKEQSVVKNDEALLKGEKIKDSQNENINLILNSLNEKEVIKEDEENFDKYYFWDKTLLEELNLHLHLEGNEGIIINYETLEIIVPEGIQLTKDGEKSYKFSDINK